MTSTIVQVIKNGDVTTITLANPGKRNALSLDMMTMLTRTFAKVGKTQALAIVLAAQGPVFSAGHDLGELVGIDLVSGRNLFGAFDELITTMQSVPQPVIAKVAGPAAAGGCQLVAACDLAIAAETATFSLPGIKRGLFCSTPLVEVSRNIGRKRALELAMTGDPITAVTAAEWGLINYAVPADLLDTNTDALVQRIIGDGSAQARALGKRTFYQQAELAKDQAYDLAVNVVAMTAVLPDAQEGFSSFVEKRAPHFTSRPN